MLSFKWIRVTLCVFLLHALSLGARQAARELTVDIVSTPDWIHSDGEGGIYLLNRWIITHFHPTGVHEDIRLPPHLDGNGDSLGKGYFVGPKGDLWLWNQPSPADPAVATRNQDSRLFKHGKGTEWEETALSLPTDGCIELRQTWTSAGELRFLCFPSDSAGQIRKVRAATVHFPVVSPWEAVDSLDWIQNTQSHAYAELTGSPWAISHEAGEPLGLFLATPGVKSWRRTVFTVGPLNGPATGRDTLPFPSDWAGPTAGRSPDWFKKERAFIVSQPKTTWVALEGFLALRYDSAWTLFLSKDQSITRLVGTGTVDRFAFSHPLIRSIPYLFTATLAVLAMASGPGWSSETGAALGGVALGSVVGGTISFVSAGMCAAPNAMCGSGEGILLPLFIVPIPMAIWAIESQATQKHADRKWVRRGAAGLGMLSGVGLYFLLPTDSGWMIAGGLMGVSLGAVVGYRLAFLP